MNNNVKEGLDEIKRIVSAEWFFDGDEAIDQRGKTTIPNGKKPLGFAYPANEQEVKDILAACNQHNIPIWPLSKGYNWGFGSASAAREGNLILVLERMNRILEVNEELAYAVVEPGVTYADMHKYLTENNINLFCDAVDGPSESSILGNALERGRGRTNYGDHFGTLCGIEVILPSGETMRTGGGPPNSKVWNVYKYGVGPSIDGLFSQGNFGVVTKGGMWLMPKHQCCMSIFLELKSHEAFIEAIDAYRRLQLEGVIESKMAIANDCFVFSSLTNCPELYREDKILDDQELADLRREYNVSVWAATCAIYGTPDVIKVKKRRIKKELSKFGKMKFVNDRLHKFVSKVVENSTREGSKNLGLSFIGYLIQKIIGKQLKMFMPVVHMHNFHKGIPSNSLIETTHFGELTELGINNKYDMTQNKTGMIWFMPVVPFEGSTMSYVNTECKKICHEHGFDYAAGIMLFEPRSAIVIMKIAFNKQDPVRCEQATQLFNALNQWSLDNGFQVYRTNVSHMETVIDCAPEFKSFLNDIKSTVDPNNIIAPGKYGLG